MFFQSTIGAFEIYGNYLRQDWQKITLHDIWTKVVTEIISIKQLLN